LRTSEVVATFLGLLLALPVLPLAHWPQFQNVARALQPHKAPGLDSETHRGWRRTHPAGSAGRRGRRRQGADAASGGDQAARKGRPGSCSGASPGAASSHRTRRVGLVVDGPGHDRLGIAPEPAPSGPSYFRTPRKFSVQRRSNPVGATTVPTRVSAASAPPLIRLLPLAVAIPEV
jgi:hypothetical protein